MARSGFDIIDDFTYILSPWNLKQRVRKSVIDWSAVAATKDEWKWCVEGLREAGEHAQGT